MRADRVRVLILRAAGINCDEETAFAWEQAGARAERVHVNRLKENPSVLREYQILTIPGGFSFGDGSAIWNNSDPDRADLRNPDGDLVSSKSYPPGC